MWISISFRVALLLLFFVLNGCNLSGDASVKHSSSYTESKKLSDLAPDQLKSELFINHNGSGYALLSTTGDTSSVSVNGTRGALFTSVRDFKFDKNSDNFAYIAMKDGKHSVITNKGGGGLYKFVGEISFSKAGVVYSAQNDDDSWDIVTGNKVVTSKYPLVSPVSASDDGAYIIYAESNSEKKQRLVSCSSSLTDCTNGTWYDAVQNPVFNPSSTKITFIARKNGKQFLVTQGLKGDDHNELKSSKYEQIVSYAVSKNEKYQAFIANKSGGKSVLVKNGTEYPSETSTNIFELIVDNSGIVYYAALADNKVRLYRDGKAVTKGDASINDISVSLDGKHLLFVKETTSNENVLVIDLKDAAKFDKIVTPQFSPDGNKIVFRARKNGERFVVVTDLNGKILKEHPHYNAVWDVGFSPDGTSVGYGARSGSEIWWKVEKL